MKDIRQLIKELRQFSVPELCDRAGQYDTMDYRIKPMVTTQKIVGPAFTVKTPIGEGAIVTNALEQVRKGDIIVGDRNGVCIIKPEDAEEIMEKAKRKIEAQEWTIAEMERTGQVMPCVIFNKGKGAENDSINR